LRLRDEGYKKEDLQQWAKTVRDLGKEWQDAFIFFKHEEAGIGPQLAQQFVTLLEWAMAEPVIFGSHDAQTLAQLRDVASRADRVALMADGHLGYVMPIGGVAAYRRQVSVVGVGFDIACGNAAIRTDRRARDYSRAELEALADEIQHVISFGMGRTNRADDAPTDHPLFADPAWSALPGKHERDGLKAKARSQLGTVGGGNHYVDVFADEAGDLWVGVHFGSRGLGHTVASGFLALSQGKKWGERVPE